MTARGRSINDMTGGGQHDSSGQITTAAWARPAESSGSAGWVPGNGNQRLPHTSPGHEQPTASQSPVPSRKWFRIVVALAVLFSIAALALSVTKWATGPGSSQPVTTTVSPPAPTYSDTEIALAKKNACSANTSAGDALTQAQRELAAIPDRNSPEAKAALANFQTVVMVETEYLKTQIKPATPDEIKSAATEFISAILAEADAETRMLPYGDIDARGNVTTAASKKLDLACKD